MLMWFKIKRLLLKYFLNKIFSKCIKVKSLIEGKEGELLYCLKGYRLDAAMLIIFT